MAATLSEYSVIHKLPNLATTQRIRHSQSLSFREPKRNSLISSFRRRSASITPENPASTNATGRKNYLTIEQLKDFLQKEEEMPAVSIEDCSKLIARFEPSIEGRQCEQLGVDGFRLLLLHEEFCIMNPNKSHRIYHDMTRPLTDYFIATSHNTLVNRINTKTKYTFYVFSYLQDNQIFGECTPETYIHAIRTGCRAVESKQYNI